MLKKIELYSKDSEWTQSVESLTPVTQTFSDLSDIAYGDSSFSFLYNFCFINITFIYRRSFGKFLVWGQMPESRPASVSVLEDTKNQRAVSVCVPHGSGHWTSLPAVLISVATSSDRKPGG